MPTFGKQKQVRFADRTTFHPPRTLTPTFTSSSLSSARSITPPLISHGPSGSSPFTIASVPLSPVKRSHYEGPIRPHPLLETSAVTWDLMDRSSTITRNNHLLSTRVRNEQATTPPLPFLSIKSIHLPWTINVRASNGSYVILEDVFDSIYRSLRTGITTTEFDWLPHKNDKKRATRAYEQRYRRFRSTSAHAKEKRGGMKRIDFLMGHTKFRGISNTGHRSDEWRLDVT